MSDAITNAQQILGCEEETTESLIYNLELYRTAAFQEYYTCMQENTTYITGGLTNSSAREKCKPLLQKNRKTYCAEKVRNQPPPVEPVTPQATGSVVLTTKDEELLMRQKEASAQKLVAERQAQVLNIKNEAINNARGALVGLVTNTVTLPGVPIIDQKILAAISLANKVKALAKERKEKSKSAISKGKKVYSYPMTPITPESTTLSSTTETPKPPTIPQLPIA